MNKSKDILSDYLLVTSFLIILEFPLNIITTFTITHIDIRGNMMDSFLLCSRLLTWVLI